MSESPFVKTRQLALGDLTRITGATMTDRWNLLEASGDRPIAGLYIQARGSHTLSAGGTARAGSPHAFAFDNLRITGQHKELGQRVVYDGPGIDLAYLSEHLGGSRVLRVPAANATGNWACDLWIPFNYPGLLGNAVLRNAFANADHPCYVDLRRYTTFTVEVRSGALTDLVSTCTAVANLRYACVVRQIMDPLPETAPHLEPEIRSITVPIDQSNPRIPVDGLKGGYIPYIAVRARDSSADTTTGSESPSFPLGLIKTVKVEQSGHEWGNEIRVEELRQITRQYFPVTPNPTGDVGIASGGGSLLGFVIFNLDTEKDGIGMADATRSAVQMYLNNNATPLQGVSAVTPATGDTAIITAPVLSPANGYDSVLAELDKQARGAA